MLPDGGTLLETAMAEGAGRRQAGGQLLALIGGSGGVGTSTVAAAMSFVAAHSGWRTLLLDCDPYGGGIDLLVGAERIPGRRWPQFAAAKGTLGELDGQLPAVDGVDVLATGRPAGPGMPANVLEGDQVAAVVSSAARSHDLLVADLPRVLSTGQLTVLQRADLVLLVVRADVRGVAAARSLSDELTEITSRLAVLVRQPRAAGRIDAETVADALTLPVVGTVAEEAALRKSAERGEPPGRSPRSQLGRLCRDLLAEELATKAAA
jgi:secretion/DNA translocation related CpaE-like protein